MVRTPRFRVIQIRSASGQPDGTPRHYSHWVSVEVDGVVQDVGIGRRDALAHLPECLRDHPKSDEIKRVVNKAYFDALMAGSATRFRAAQPRA
jgi:ubiquinone/menaquinone biosynthesis C-methylase UbiE